MKKQTILSITLLMSLAGCKDGKKAYTPQSQPPKQVVQRSDVFSTVNIPLAEHSKEIDFEEDNEVLSFFDDESNEFSFDQDEEFSNVAENNTDTSSDDHRVLSWIESINEDNDLKAIHFGFNKYGIAQEEKEIVAADIAMIQDLLDVIDENAIIMIEGHACHSAGSASYNMALSEKRAKYIRDLLVAAGIDANRIRIVGRGQEVPVLVDGKPVTGNRDQQKLNRRVEIRIVDVA